LTESKQVALEEFLHENLHTGCIHTSKSLWPHCSSLSRRKMESSNNPSCHKVNDATIKNRSHYFDQQTCHKLKGSKIFTKLDIWWGYIMSGMKEGDEWKAAFRTTVVCTNLRLCSLVLPIPCHVPSHDGSHIPRPHHRRTCSIYINNIVIHTRQRKNTGLSPRKF